MGQLIRQIKKKNGLIRRFAEEEDAVGVVEIILILVVLRIKYFALHIKKFRFTVYALQKNISTEYPVPVCIQQGFLQNFVMLIFQIVECSTIVCTFTCDVF